jgi:RNA recognition motif-containing protein
VKLYVGNLPYSAREDDVKEQFSAFGTVTSVRVITDRETGRSKGFAFVEFENDEEAKAAIEGLNGKDLNGRALVVNEARPQEDRPRYNNNGGGNRRDFSGSDFRKRDW